MLVKKSRAWYGMNLKSNCVYQLMHESKLKVNTKVSGSKVYIFYFQVHLLLLLFTLLFNYFTFTSVYFTFRYFRLTFTFIKSFTSSNPGPYEHMFLCGFSSWTSLYEWLHIFLWVFVMHIFVRITMHILCVWVFVMHIYVWMAILFPISFQYVSVKRE